jgi:hypothetical protein
LSGPFKLKWYREKHDNLEKTFLILIFCMIFLVGSIVFSLGYLCITVIGIVSILGILFSIWLLFLSEKYIATNIIFGDLKVDLSMDGFRKLKYIFQDLFENNNIKFQNVREDKYGFDLKLSEKNIIISVRSDYNKVGYSQYWYLKIEISPFDQETEIYIDYLKRKINDRMQKEIG